MEVPGRTSDSDIIVLGSSDADEDVYCDPCENDGEMQPADGFCEDCQEYLCSSCFKIHRRPLLWRHHVLLDKDAMPKTKTKQELNYECTEACTEHSTKIIEYFCQTHDQLGCPVCITGNHRACNNVDYIPHIAKRYGESSEIKGLFDSLEGLQEETNEYTATAKNDVQKIAEYEKNANARVLQLRDEFNSICDRLKEDIDSVRRADERKINNSVRKYEEISRKIKTRVAVLEKKRAEKKMSQLFTEAKLSNISVVDLAKELESAKENANIRHYDIDFNIEEFRDGLKLNFLDDEKDTEEIESFNPSDHLNKLTDDIPRQATASSQQTVSAGPPVVSPQPMFLSQPMEFQMGGPPTTMNPFTISKQAMTVRPPPPYQGPVINPQPMFGSQPMNLPSDGPPATLYPYTTPQQTMPRLNIPFGVPNSHQGPQQYHPWTFPRQQFTSFAPNSGKDVTTEILKTTEEEDYQDTASKSNSAEISEISKQAMTVRPPPPYQGPVINPQPMFGSQPMNLPSGGPPATLYPYTTPQQTMPRLNIPFGVPNSHQGPQQYHPWTFPRQQFTSFAPNSGKDVTAEILKTTEEEDYQDTASKSNSAEISEVGTMLNDMIVRRKMDNEAVMHWIDRNVDATTREQPHFIRALMTVVCNSAIKGNNGEEKLEVIKISDRDDLLQRYIDHDSELELQALYAVQALVTQLGHPPGVIWSIFETLFDESIIARDTLFQWEESEEEPDGKVQCLEETTELLYWLRE